MSDAPIAEIEFLRKLQRLLNEGDFVATYKFALLNALADLSLERSIEEDGSLRVPLRAIAEKFIEYYWRQARPYGALDGMLSCCARVLADKRPSSMSSCSLQTIRATYVVARASQWLGRARLYRRKNGCENAALETPNRGQRVGRVSLSSRGVRWFQYPLAARSSRGLSCASWARARRRARCMDPSDQCHRLPIARFFASQISRHSYSGQSAAVSKASLACCARIRADAVSIALAACRRAAASIIS